MPKVKNPLMSLEARGGIGGLVYNTWRGINTVKTNTSPTGQGSAGRLAAQALLSTISKKWQNLSDADRAGWNQYAIDHTLPDWTGSPKRITGFNWYVMCATQQQRCGTTPTNPPPSALQPNAITGLVMTKATVDLKIAWTAPVGAGLKIDVWLVGPQSAGRQGRLEMAKPTMLAAATTGTAVTLKAAAVAGRYTAFARMIDTATGLTSPWVSCLFDF